MRRFAAGIVCAACVLGAADNGVWKVTPAPAASIERDRVADLTAHRKAVAAQIPADGMLLLYAAEPRNYAGDVDWPFRQENDFFYLTGINQPGSALVMIPSGAGIHEILFMAPSNPAQENWTGHILTPEEGRKISGIETIWDARRLNEFLAAVMPAAKAAFAEPERGGRGAGGGRGARGGVAATPAIPVDLATAFPKPVGQLLLLQGRGPEYTREVALGEKVGGAVKVVNAVQTFSAARRVKSEREIDILKHAVDITAEGFQRAYALGVPGTPEYEIQAQFEFTFLRRNAHWGYPCIVASGVNATTLHYETNKDTMHAGDLLLMDDAAEYEGYSVDVTRTIPVSGKYSKLQADIYRLVWEAQKAGIDAARPGKTGADITGAANKVFGEGLYKLGLITEPGNMQQIRVWFNHGISHGIGLNVHDPGGREFQPGMAITMEPGIYIRPDALENLPKTPENEKFITAVKPAFEKYKGIGVRIEDDVLITNGEAQVLSANIPSKLEDVEAAIAKLRKSVKSTPLP
jgi:Xaa-Pro aminopeptidase